MLLKKSASIVLASLRGSTYETEYASPFRSLRPCWSNFLNSLLILLEPSEFVRLPLLAATTFEHCGNLPQLAPANHSRLPPATQLSLKVQLVTFLPLGVASAPVLLKHQGRLLKPALFTRVRDETAETPRDTGVRSREGGRQT